MRGIPIARDIVEGPAKREYSALDRFRAAMELSEMDEYTATQGLDFGGALGEDYAFGRDDILDRLEAGDKIGKLSPKELNEKFPYVEKPFTKPTSYLVADHLNKEAKRRIELQQIISNDGTASGASSIGYSLVGGLAAGATDPMNLAVDVALTVGTAGLGKVLTTVAQTGKAAKYATKLTKTGRALQGIGLTKKGMFAKEAIEGVVGNAALEPIAMESMERAQVDYDEVDAAATILGGGLALPTLKFGLTKGFEGVKTLPRYIKNDDNAVLRTFKAVQDNLQAGKNYVKNLEFFSNRRKSALEGVNRQFVEPGSIHDNFKIERVPSTEIKTRKFYAGGKSIGGFDFNNNHVVGEFLGEGVHLSDNPNMINNISAMPENTSKGNFHEINLEKANLLDLDQATDSELGLAVKNAIPEEYKEIFDQVNSLKDAVTRTRDAIAAKEGISDIEASNIINGEMKKLGIDGYHYHEKETGNYAFVFDPEKVSAGEKFRSDQRLIPETDKKSEAQLREYIASEESNLYYDPAAKSQEIQADQYGKEKQRIRDAIPEQQQALYDDFEANFDKHKGTGALPKEYEIEAEAIKIQKQLDDLEDEELDFLVDCLSKGGE